MILYVLIVNGEYPNSYGDYSHVEQARTTRIISDDYGEERSAER
jgi:hypothetical protein